MKKVSAIVRSEKLGAVEEALVDSGRPDISVSRVAGYSGRPMLDRGELTPHMRIDIILPDGSVEEVIEVICEAAWTGLQGDGIVFVEPVDRITKIKTSQRPGRS